MDSTSVSLLKRLKHSNHDKDWRRFVELYAPLIYCWGKDRGLSHTDAGDLVQEVLLVVHAKIATFDYDSQGRFRGWLRTVALNKAIDLNRKNRVRSAIELTEMGNDEPRQVAASDLLEEAEYAGFLIRRARALLEHEFEPSTWQAAMAFISGDQSAREVGEEFGLSENAVRVAKCRILRRLREELEGLI